MHCCQERNFEAAAGARVGIDFRGQFPLTANIQYEKDLLDPSLFNACLLNATRICG